MKTWLSALVMVFAVAFAWRWGGAAEAAMMRNPPPKEDPEEEPGEDCECPPKEIDQGCVKIKLDLGRTSVLSGRRPVSLRVYTNTASEAIFTPEELKVVMDYTAPGEVVFIQRTGQEIHFRFAEGESLGVPDPGVHRELNERLQMVDAEGWATAEDPAYYDLYPGDGSVWRFYATDVTGHLGELVSHTDARGRVTTLADFGVEILRDAHGAVRQVLTPSRLADVTVRGAAEYEVCIYPLTERPNFADGRYVPPQATPIRRLTMKRGKDSRELLATLQKGQGQPRAYVYAFVNGDWGLRTPEGLEKTRELMESDDGFVTQAHTLTRKNGKTLEREVDTYEEAQWGFVKVRSEEGEGAASRWREWEYYFKTDAAVGAYKGKVRERRASNGEVVRHRYDAQGRRVETRRTDAAGSFLEVTAVSYAPVAAGDRTSLMDTRPRCEVVSERDPESGEMVEVSRTYHVYLPTEEITERAATAGAAYGAAGALRTVRTWYAPDDARPFYAGRLASVRDEDGSLRVYDYRVEDERWIETVTALHEQAPEPVSGRTTRSATVYDRVGNVVERNQEAFIDGTWHLIDRTVYEYDIGGHVIKETDFAGRETVSVWGDACCGKVSETLPDGTRRTFAYDEEGNLLSQTTLRAGAHTVTYRRDDLGRVVRVEREGLNPETTDYDILGRVVRRVDIRGGVTQTAYSLDGNTVTTTFPNGGTQIRKTDALGRLLELSGTAVRPQVVTYGPLWERVATGARWQQTEQNLLGQTVRQNRSGANGSTLETTTAYDTYGRVSQITVAGQPTQTFAYASTGEQTALTQTVGEVWRKQESETDYLLREGEVWQRQATTQSCSDADIASLTQSAYAQVSGLSVTNTFNQITVDIRGNETRTFGNDTQRTTLLPSCSNPQIERYAFGQLVETVDTACVTNRFEYDALDRRIASIDGRNNRTAYAYDAKGNLVSTTDAVGAVTAYGYDVMGQTVAVTNALGNVTVYDYDLRGNKTYEGGATYPVRYAYDVFGNKTSMTTYRDESSGVGDTTTWAYDEASGVLLSKIYADGKGLTYTYTDDGRLATRTNARGIVTTYTYDTWGQLLSVDYADATPDIAYTYDAMGRQTSASDAAGVTTFTYDATGQLTSEQVSGLYSKTLTRHYDTFGRNVGYSVDGTRKNTLAYDPATGRLATMGDFAWEYLPGSHLKSRLTYPNGATAEWDYEPTRDLLARVTNTINGTVASQYTYTNDLLGRRTEIGKSGSMMALDETQSYGYNVRDELTSGQNQTYVYDDIGNRTTAEGKTYTANNLNQYTAIDDFTPQYDADGNQTLIKTETGIWSVTYNAENRPVCWTRGDTIVTMAFDRLGRRVDYQETRDDQVATHFRFVYDNYLCVQRLNAANGNAVRTEFVWDPTEPIATRPLVMHAKNWGLNLFYTHDGNKNVSEVFYHALQNGIAAHYDYAPFGAVTRTSRATRVTNRDLLSENPFRFSSEFHDDTLALVYYNYRHYNPKDGRWLGRDLCKTNNKYRFLGNNGNTSRDILGLYDEKVHYYFIFGVFFQMGYLEEEAEMIAFASNYVDTGRWNPLPEEWLYSNNLIPSSELRRTRRLLHNLGNLSSQQIDCYRECVRCLAKCNPKDLQRIGVLLHVLGDTYAHRDPNGDGYGVYLGHGLAGTEPDDVRSQDYHGPSRFIMYGVTIHMDFAPKDMQFSELLYKYLYLKKDNGEYYHSDLDVFKAFAGKSPNHQIEMREDAELDRKIEDLLPSLESCYEKAREVQP